MGAICTIGGFTNTDEAGFGRFYEPIVFAKVDSGMRISISLTFRPAFGIQAVDLPSEAT